MTSCRPRVFISYSHDSQSHSDKVLEFAFALRSNGIDVELDQFHTDEIVDWPTWCEEKISREHADFVLCICTAKYRDRIEGTVPPEEGKGAYWEGSLLRKELYDTKGNRRIVPVLFHGEPESSILGFLQGWTFCRIRDFALSDSGYEHLLRILTGKASVIKNDLGEIPDLTPRSLPFPPAPPAPSVLVFPTRLRHGAEKLFGRENRLADLDAAWDDGKTHVVTLVAWGGVGKTSLVFDWMAGMARDGWRGPERVFDWSFYSQGTHEQGSASADSFVSEALKFFGDEKMAGSAASPWEKGARLAQLVAQRRTLLVLDGMEPLQYPPGPMSGKLKDGAIEALLKGLAQHNPGLCIVTTREHVADLAPFHGTTAPEWKLEHLSEEAGAALLSRTGVKGTERELRKASEEVKGHALTLTLLGSYLAKAHGGDIRKRSLVKFSEADAKVQGGHAFKVMTAYEKWLAESGEDGQRQLAILRLMGFFDRPADPACLAALRERPAIRKLTERLTALSDADWNLAVAALEEADLVKTSSYEPKKVKGYGEDAKSKSLVGTPLGEAEDFEPARSFRSGGDVLDAHPLVREYFAEQVRHGNPKAWREGHRRLYEHLKASAPYWPEGMEGLQPLYQAVAHGCQAGLYEDALDKVYIDRISRGTEGAQAFHSTKKLGLFGADLGAVACFFERLWTHLSASLSQADQAWLLNEAAVMLRAFGRLNEAVEPMRVSLGMYERREQWVQASICASNLSELELMLGEVSSAVRDAEKSVDFAQRSGDEFWRMVRLTTLCDALHQAGRATEALELFREAEGIQVKRHPEYPLLYSVRGFQYCDLLPTDSERAAWRHSIGSGAGEGPQQDVGAELVARCREVEQRAAQTLKWAEEHLGLLPVALDHLTLGCAPLYHALLAGEPSERAAALQCAREQLEAAVGGIRRAGTAHHLPRGLLSRACLRHVESDVEGAGADLDEAWEIAERGPMRLHMADILLHRARLFRDKDALARAGELVRECGYHRRDAELADAEEAAKGW